MKEYIKLMRCKHYVKNILIFLPLIFSKKALSLNNFFDVFLGLIAFSIISSVVYVINDINDVEADRKHEKKKFRPIASGKVSIRNAWIFVIVLFSISIIINIFILGNNISGYIWIIAYLILNILYSIKLKHIAIVDIAILASGFLIRVFYGAEITNVEVSNWLYLTVLSFSLFMGLGKRRNEIIKLGENGRKVLEQYNKTFINNNMYMCLALTIVFYALWCMDIGIANIIWTVPLIIIILMDYSLIIEGDSYGDPVDVVLENKTLLILISVYAIIMFWLIYMI